MNHQTSLEIKALELGPNVLENRKNLKTQSDCVMIDSDEFCRLAISNQELIRVDFPSAEMKGFAESNTGIRYLIENEKLVVLGI